MTSMNHTRICLIDGCEANYITRGLCSKHYQRLRKTGTTDPAAIPTMSERFWVKVNKKSTCWLWEASINNMGYGVFGLNKQTYLAHRVSWTFKNGRIPNRLLKNGLKET